MLFCFTSSTAPSRVEGGTEGGTTKGGRRTSNGGALVLPVCGTGGSGKTEVSVGEAEDDVLLASVWLLPPASTGVTSVGGGRGSVTWMVGWAWTQKGSSSVKKLSYTC